jgi:hypothetical protein
MFHNRGSSIRLSMRGLAVVFTCMVCSSMAFAATETGYSGKAYGTAVKVAPGVTSITSGMTAVSELCTEATGVTNTNSVAGVTLPPLAVTGVVDTSVASVAQTGSTASVSKSTVAGVNLLGGLVTADAVTAESSAIDTAGVFSTSSNGTIFANLKVLGILLPINVAPNTRIILPGIGEVVLNQQISQVTATAAELTINMIHIRINQVNTLGLPVGTDLIVAHAKSSTLTNVGLLDGFAYGSALSAGIVHAGRSAYITLPCSGTTNGEVESNDVAGVSVPGILTLGAVHTTAQGSETTTGSSGETTAKVAGTNLVAGLLTADVIMADATVSTDGTTITLGDAGSLFLNLAIAGHPEIGSNPPPNTRVHIAGLGTLWLHRVIQTSTSIEVRMVELVVNTANSLGLPVGADVRIAVAHVGVINQ